jgi:hypothetical protein
MAADVRKRGSYVPIAAHIKTDINKNRRRRKEGK